MVVERVAEHRADDAELPDCALRDELLQALRLRIVAVHERLAQVEAGAVGGVERGSHLFRVTRKRLLAEHVLARLEGAHRPVAVHRVGQRDVHRLDLRVGEQVIVRSERTWDIPLFRVLVGASLVAACDGNELDLARRVRAGNHLPVDVGRGDDSPLHGIRHVRTIAEWKRSASACSATRSWAKPTRTRSRRSPT